jgi:hypothetical protein
VPEDALATLKNAQSAIKSAGIVSTLADPSQLREKFVQVMCLHHNNNCMCVFFKRFVHATVRLISSKVHCFGALFACVGGWGATVRQISS